jgi:hypothetical protein
MAEGLLWLAEPRNSAEGNQPPAQLRLSNKLPFLQLPPENPTVMGENSHHSDGLTTAASLACC